MMQVTLTKEMSQLLIEIECEQKKFGGMTLPLALTDKLRKSSRKKSSYASNKIEGNPLTEAQVEEVIDSSKRHYLKPEQEVRNYFDALIYLEQAIERKTPFTIDLLLKTQALVVRGAGEERKGIRGPMPPGILFAVYDDVTGAAEYIPPEASELNGLLEELFDYVSQSPDHPLIKAAVFHYQLLTIHPFEDGNGRTARLLVDYLLDQYGYGFGRIGALEEYFAYDIDAYYRSLQMGLPALCYSGRLDPPHPEIWVTYFLKMVLLHARKAVELASAPEAQQAVAGYSYLNYKERIFLKTLVKEKRTTFTPIEMSKQFSVTNRTIINWCATLCKNGFLKPVTSGSRVRFYTMTSLTLGLSPDELN